ncbi:MAG: acylneuraminate cytidylyltransferase family protein [Gammaproteobacteria bacterium]|nr:acylneuraminate cytidylyltransferase family protein [Gammaproteobacteria bacterium]MBU0788307.1 acylneuraminate cytidylyltransferase family protein [Gammaproteobacteria bacterium]MBU0815196.1 acylneuraminate cytidylyltransferase family protein [Gammaproteobacteria bacterium]MBU1785696.1 acylneuraminate cytidylyltransferase family protein [Gammaproteobacteria bacterium]
MKILAVIPARGGSKSVPRKNIAHIAGKPLLSFTVEEAQKVPAITDLVVSTDDQEIASVARSLGVQVPFLRPTELATDQAQSAPVLRHCLLEMEALRGLRYDAVLMLQPTTPLRQACHIETAIDMLVAYECDSVVSVVSVGGYHPFRMKRLVGKQLINLIDQGFEDMRPRQVLPPVYIRNGAVYLSRRHVVAEQEQVVGSVCLGFEMGADESVNIDDRLDFKMAEILLKERATW